MLKKAGIISKKKPSKGCSDRGNWYKLPNFAKKLEQLRKGLSKEAEWFHSSRVLLDYGDVQLRSYLGFWVLASCHACRPYRTLE